MMHLEFISLVDVVSTLRKLAEWGDGGLIAKQVDKEGCRGGLSSALVLEGCILLERAVVVLCLAWKCVTAGCCEIGEKCGGRKFKPIPNNPWRHNVANRAPLSGRGGQRILFFIFSLDFLPQLRSPNTSVVNSKAIVTVASIHFYAKTGRVIDLRDRFDESLWGCLRLEGSSLPF
ncbi:hypothetical protein Tco_0008974 [Tanacetum coccineum]